jgi:hypothetical protein
MCACLRVVDVCVPQSSGCMPQSSGCVRASDVTTNVYVDKVETLKSIASNSDEHNRSVNNIHN